VSTLSPYFNFFISMMFLATDALGMRTQVIPLFDSKWEIILAMVVWSLG